MNPDDIPWRHRAYNAPLWDTPEYWERREAREKLKAARQRISRTERPHRTRRFKIAKASKRRNRA